MFPKREFYLAKRFPLVIFAAHFCRVTYLVAFLGMVVSLGGLIAGLGARTIVPLFMWGAFVLWSMAMWFGMGVYIKMMSLPFLEQHKTFVKIRSVLFVVFPWFLMPVIIAFHLAAITVFAVLEYSALFNPDMDFFGLRFFD